MTYCCNTLKEQVSHRCADHPDPADCPDALIVEIQHTSEFGIRIHDGGGSFVRIHNCPWCGADLSRPALEQIERGSPTGEENEGAHVFLLWHLHRHDDGYEDEKLIGVYSTEYAARAAQRRVANQPGFRQQPDSFEVASYRVDRDNWVEGFGEG
jgi:uncharacterized protein DUF6980